MGAMFDPGQLVRVNLAGLVTFQADAVAHGVRALLGARQNTVKQTSEQPPKYLVELLFSFRGVSHVEVPADRIHAAK